MTTVDEFLSEFGYIYKFLGLGDIDSRFVVLGLQEKAITNSKGDPSGWRKAVGDRKFGEYDFPLWCMREDGSYFHSSPKDFNDGESCGYWDVAIEFLEAVTDMKIPHDRIFFTETDPFARENNKNYVGDSVSEDVSKNISKRYELDDGDRYDLPFGVGSLSDKRLQRLSDLLLGLDKEQRVKLILIATPKPLDNLGIEYRNKGKFYGEYQGTGYSYFIESGNLFLICPHFAYLNEKEMNKRGNEKKKEDKKKILENLKRENYLFKNHLGIH